MSFASLTEAKTRSGSMLLKRAVYRSKFSTREGLLERLFTLAFRGLVYPQIWEDPIVDLEAMEIGPEHHIVAIASAGCNVLSYLTADPMRITAVDINRAHVALIRLKLAGLKGLPGWREYYRFFGEADDAQNLRDYENFVRPLLDVETRRYWDDQTLTGRRRIGFFSRNIYARGLLGRFIGASHIVARLYGTDLHRFGDCRSLKEQRLFFDSEIAPLFEKRFVRWITARKAALFGLGIPPAQYEALAGGVPMVDILRQRLERLACSFPMRENYFAWQAFTRGYAPGVAGPLPPYLSSDNFDQVRARAHRVSVAQISLTEVLNEMLPSSVDRVVLLDAQDWMTTAQLNTLWTAITRVARRNARVIFRTAGISTILPGRVDQGILQHWEYLAQRSRELCKRDRSSIYGGFHIYERCTDA